MNVMRWSSGVLVIILWTGGINALQPVCTPDESTNPYCVCHFDNGSVIDLRSISRKNRPRFSNIKGTDDATTFSYDPCYPFNTRHGCVNATICKQVSGKADTTVNNYNPEGSSFVVESSNQLYIKYIDGETTEIQSKVTLRCDNTSSSPNMVIDNGYLDDTGQNFILTSKCSCADGCKSEPRRNHKSSIDPGYIGIGVLSGMVLCSPAHLVCIAVNAKSMKV
ncbi:uncharacterized protein [Dysidea avara]|uniref:uncharacterized protein isoform X2 n=1 Tax=Dysidea avara TaxID=196820 RepID=UPI0033290BF0